MQKSNGAIIEVENLVKDYSNGVGDIAVLREVNFKVHSQEMVAVMGPSGSGKTTLLFILGLLLPATGGHYRFLGEDVLSLDRSAQAEFRRQRVGFVFQSCDLLENSTVYENLEFPLIYGGVERSNRPAKIIAALERVNLGHRLHHPANLLSGGERQRVAVARALVNQPQVILADEPTGQLDRTNSHMVMTYFEKIVANGDATVIIVTHDPEVGSRCSKIYSMLDGILSEQ